MMEGLRLKLSFSSHLGGEEDADAVSNTSFMLTISPPLLSSSIRSSRVIGLLQRFLGPVKKILSFQLMEVYNSPR